MLGASPLPKEDDDVLLPMADEQAWLLGQLAALIKRHGFETFVNAPMLEPTPVFFPDRWAGGAASMRRLAQRLLHYAGLGEYAADVAIHEDDPDRDEPEGKPLPLQGEDINAWFVGFGRDPAGRGACRLGVEATAMRDPATMVAATARAVAAAYRQRHGLTVKHRATEERLVDLTTVYLGFGILTTDASRRHTSSADGNFRSSRRVARLGVLPPQAMSFLLAAHTRARGLDRKGHRYIAKRLQHNQAAFFRRGLEVLGSDDDVRRRLGVPDLDDWPDPPSMRTLIPPIADDGGDEVEEEVKGLDKGVVDKNKGKPVFRVERSAALRIAKLLAMPVLLGGGLVARGFQGVELPMWQVMLVAAGLALFGLLVGWMLKDSRCSEPKCGAPLTPEMTTCPRCGGEVAGVINHPRERLAAEEALKRSSSSLSELSGESEDSTDRPPEG